ncbi:MAG: BON domain-containing protein [Deltaproteobacteria bacterium]|nr:BON domain-containing protein [Deltaproteobacteria bacterium]
MILSVFAVLAACTPAKNTAVGAAHGTKEAAEKAATATNDIAITAAIEGKLADDELVHARDIDVDTAQGVVYLRGTQPSEDAKRRAEQVARDTDGVRQVVNELTVR